MNANYTHVLYILDRSGSMAPVKPDVIGGFNQFLAEQQAAPGKCSVTLVQFDDQYEESFSFREVKKARPLADTDYVPRGFTALYDAVGKAVTSEGERLASLPEDERPARVIVVIHTDGQENSSKEFTAAQARSMITHQQEKYSWVVTFLGADLSVAKQAQNLGVAAGLSGAYGGAAKTGAAITNLSRRVLRARAAAPEAVGASMAYTADDKSEIT